MIKIRHYKSKTNITYTFIYEKLWQSILADIISIIVTILFFTGLYFNYKYLDNSVIVKLFIIIVLILMYLSRINSTIKKYENKDEFLDDIRKELEELVK